MAPKSTILILTAIVFGSTAAADDDNWVRIKLDERFRSEGAAAADLNNDGMPDVTAGDVWYQAPSSAADLTDAGKWVTREIRVPGDFVAGKGYSNSFANATWDMNKDGWNDVVIIGFPGDPFHWYQNPGKSGGEWKEHVIWTSICNESPEFEDLNKDGKPEFVFGSQPEAKVGFVEIPAADKVTEKFAFHAISAESAEPASNKNRGLDNGTFKYYHGLGAGDMNGDGHRDIIIAHGWWESPGNLTSKATWQFHPIAVDGKPLPKISLEYLRRRPGHGRRRGSVFKLRSRLRRLVGRKQGRRRLGTSRNRQVVFANSCR